jgi:hypothetical protein
MNYIDLQYNYWPNKKCKSLVPGANEYQLGAKR